MTTFIYYILLEINKHGMVGTLDECAMNSV